MLLIVNCSVCLIAQRDMKIAICNSNDREMKYLYHLVPVIKGHLVELVGFNFN